MKLESLAFLGILRAVKPEEKDDKSGEDTSTEVEKIKREDLPDDIWSICEELRQFFPKICPKVFLPDGWGMNSKLILN